MLVSVEADGPAIVITLALSVEELRELIGAADALGSAGFVL